MSKTACGMRRATFAPAKAASSTTGSSSASIISVSRVNSPSPAENGSLNRLITAKNHAEVPRKVITGMRIISRYSDITGPAALATMVVNPPSRP